MSITFRIGKDEHDRIWQRTLLNGHWGIEKTLVKWLFGRTCHFNKFDWLKPLNQTHWR